MNLKVIADIESSKRALTVRDLAEILSLSEKVLYRLIRQGKLPALRVGTSVRLDPAATAKWIRARVTIS